MQPLYSNYENHLTLSRLRVWVCVIFLAVLLHLALWKFSPYLNLKPQATPIDLIPISPEQLSQLKNQWKNKEQKLLLKKNQTASETAPENADYFSDKNIKVKKEQQAFNQDVLPQNPKTLRKQSLSNLGVSYNLKPPIESAEIDPNQHSSFSDQNLLDKTLPFGSENLLNSIESKYYSFYSRLYEAIGPIWQSQIRSITLGKTLPEGEYTTSMELILDSMGELIETRILQSSGIQAFDQAVITSWRRVGRFPNPPKDLQDDNGYVRTGWSFTVVVDSSLNLRLAEPERVY